MDNQWRAVLVSAFPDTSVEDHASIVNASKLALRDVQVAYAQQLAQLDTEYQIAAARMLEMYNKNKASVDRRLRELNARLNTFSPIFVLPPEILCAIFLEYAQACWEKFRAQRREARSCPLYPWATLAHVCQHWRDVVLQTPMLWTHITPSRPDIVDFESSHTKNLPLTVLHTQRTTPESLCLVLAHLPRIQALELVVTPRSLDVLSDAPGASPRNAALLTDLEIEIALDDAETDRMIPFFSNLDMPRITSLRASGTSLRSLCTLMRPTLTSLHMSPCWQWYHDTNILLDALRGVPALEVLSVRFPKPLAQLESQAPIAPHAPVSLPRLTTIQLYDHDTGVLPAKLLSHLTFPATCTIQFHQHTLGRSPLDHDAAGLVVSHITRTLSDPDFTAAFRPRTLSLVSTDRDAASLGIWTEPRALRELRTPCWWAPGDADASFITLHATLPELVGGVLSAINLSEATIAHVAARLAPEAWQRVFGSATRLETVEVRGNDAVRAFMSAFAVPVPSAERSVGLNSCASGATVGAPGRLLFPSLKTLVLKSLDFGIEQESSGLLSHVVSSLVSRRVAFGLPSPSLDRLELDCIRRVSPATIQYILNSRIAKVVVVNNTEYAHI
ncbi:hypothetical protein EIP86_003183 [Pleurotus ostreatoroseus]|nr:hypothetical protein EIP86_003183 [Pleurotus ostreatoroseus]